EQDWNGRDRKPYLLGEDGQEHDYLDMSEKKIQRFLHGVIPGLRTQHLTEGDRQRTHVIRTILPTAVDKKRRRPAHAVLPACADVRADTVKISVFVERFTEARSIEAELSRIVHQIAVFQFPLVGKQRGIHCPKLALCGCGFSSFSGLYGMGM